ncbi:MAG: 30S ribosomal protein S2 [Candidatus Campbellbacteria bacterium]|nr:30S ribosomal protein S2 [Candidatus Campbellbacteria bacterium]
MEKETPQINKAAVEDLFKVGAHYGYVKRLRHPSVMPFLFGTKNNIEIFDLEKTYQALEEAKSYVSGLAQKGKMILFVSGKAEGKEAIKKAAESIQMPYVNGRWKGGTLTNFEEIRKRVKKLEELVEKREAGELGKYTKKERLLIDREINSLEEGFAGLTQMTRLPDAIYIVDVAHEEIALSEARTLGIPVISLSNSDCDFSKIDYPIPGNDANLHSITYFTSQIAEAYKQAQ